MITWRREDGVAVITADYKLYSRLGDEFLVFVPEAGAAPATRVTLTYDQWLELGEPDGLVLTVTAKAAT